MARRTEVNVKGWIEPMLATLTREYFSDQDWIYEPKLDGVRCIAFKRANSVQMYSRNKLPLHEGHADVRSALEGISHNFVIDGEIAATFQGRTSFSAWQQRKHLSATEQRRIKIHFHVFDIMRFDGKDLRRLPVLERKAFLKQGGFAGGPIKVVAHKRTHGERYLNEACAKGMEGIIAKRIASPYVGGRSKDWLKFKCGSEQELVIGGWTDPQGSRVGFGALLVGYYEDGRLRYAGKVGTGYGGGLLIELTQKLAALAGDENPFSDAPRVPKGVHWVRPELVAQVGFAEWTHDGRLRHPRFIGLREDKSPQDVVREG